MITWITFPDRLKSGDIISCDIDGEIVSGIVHLWRNDISIVSTGPMAGLRGGSHIMLMAPYAFLASNGYGTRHAEQAAKRILPELWDGYLKIMTLCPVISSGLDAYNIAYDKIEEEIRGLSSKKSEFKRGSTAGEIDDRSCQRGLAQIKKKIDELRMKKGGLFESMFHIDEHCGHGICNKKEIISSIIGREVR